METLEVEQTFSLSGNARDVYLSNDETKLFVANWTEGLQVLDVSDTNAITLLQHYKSIGKAGTITMSQDEESIYLSGDSSRSSNTPVIKLDISDLSDIKINSILYLQNNP